MPTANLDVVAAGFCRQRRILPVSVGKGGGEFALSRFSFTAKGRSDDGRLEIASTGTGTFKVGTVSLMPGDNVQGMRADTLAVLKELDSPVYRWPGGNFVSGYDWKDGLGDRDRRPPRKNPAWKGVDFVAYSPKDGNHVAYLGKQILQRGTKVGDFLVTSIGEETRPAAAFFGFTYEQP